MVIYLIQNDKEKGESERQRSELGRKAKRKEKHAREKDKGTNNKEMRTGKVGYLLQLDTTSSHTSPLPGRLYSVSDPSNARRLVVGPAPTSSSKCLPPFSTLRHSACRVSVTITQAR
jgi:hypothetical protein